MESEEAAFVRGLPPDPQTVLLELIREVDIQFLCRPEDDQGDDLRAWARTALERCGRIAMCQTLLDQEQARLYDLVDTHDSQFRFRLVPGIIGAEFAERRDGEWLDKLITDASHDREQVLDVAEVELTPIMRQRVHRWKSHFIRYTTTPEIDQHYLRAGMLRVYRMSGQ